MLNCLNKEISIHDVEKRLIDAEHIVVLHSHGLLPGVKKSHASLLHKNVTAIAFDFQNVATLKIALLKACEVDNSLVIIASYYQTWIQKWLVADLAQSYLNDFITSEHIEIIALPGIASGIGGIFYRHYLENIPKITQVLACLSDDYSKEMFIDVLNFRINHFSVAMLADDKIPLSKNRQLKIENNAKKIESSLGENVPLYLRSNVAFKLSVDEYQYKNKITLQNKQSILNCGAYNNSSVVFSLLSPKAQVFAFEPQIDVHLQNIEIAKKITNIVPVNKGLWKENARLFFHTRIDSAGSSTGSKLIEEENESTSFIEVTNLDCYVQDHQLLNVDFIKMDVEGAELEALDGAADVITKFKPDLAISIYHEPEHLYEIPLKIKALVNDYDIYIDHKYAGVCETVCFATVKKD